MKQITLAVLGLSLSAASWALAPASDEDIALLHWLPETAGEAMIRTRALSQWLDQVDTDALDWRRQVDLRAITLARQAQTQRPLDSVSVDGMLGWLVQARDQDLASPGTSDLLAASMLSAVGPDSSRDPVPIQVRQRAEPIWAELRQRLHEAGVAEPDLEISAFWAGPRALVAEMDDRERAHAREQVRRVRTLDSMDGGDRLVVLARVAAAESEAAWRRGDELRALWSLLEALTLAAANGSPIEALEQIAEMTEAGEARLRGVDEGFPVVLAQLQDAARYLAEQPPEVDSAALDLLDAYFRLALFAPDASFYLDQPVREHLVQAINECQAAPDLVGPLPRQLFEQCPERLFALLRDGLTTEELVGGESGPFASEFLRREMSLISWQRARYLDGHLNWLLQAGCEPPEWNNPLEAAILVQYLATWVPQRPVFFGALRWQEALEDLQDGVTSQLEQQADWIDCLSGQGGQRRDPVTRLLLLHARALADLGTALDAAYREFQNEATRPGSDVNLDGSVDQVTVYRPEDLNVQPCTGGQTCGARVELPVSRALLGLFPNTYLLADQLAIGRLGLCYESVRWVDREMRSARPQDPRVANYFGRLSFELVGTFDDGSGPETVFRQRLTAAEPAHYLFAEAGESILELDCPASLAGEPVGSELPPGRRGLVPNRLTYFAATPVTAEALLTANWDRGAEWRDWFLAADRVETLETRSPTALQGRVQAALDDLVTRRERRLAARLLAFNEDDVLSRAMAEVADNAAFLRRVMELHYPRLIRHDVRLRSYLTGSRSLLGRDQVRRFRDAGRPLVELAAEGRERLSLLQAAWEEQPEILREQGQTVPETAVVLGQIDRLRRLTQPPPASAESSPDP
ncbi:MAG: hypothetical protein EA419_08290 [Wenzhouxiangella sp.]|nr:MAG: hypothetical protein EA419_08290 [Wenzhouxiangella sp.]